VTKTAELAFDLGLTPDELDRILETLGREPSVAELAMYAAMWSEHCSYKSSKIHLKTLPTEGPCVVLGPGENAGVVDVGEGLVAVFKLESHNHPSAIEPVQGAATGVGGIIRDVIATGARPVALLDPLRFGPPDQWRNRYLLGGVVAGISQYGNSIGVPTVGGEVKFDPSYAGNPLVNVMCVGVARREHIVRAQAHGVGNVAVLFGAKTGRDGIGGVSVLASRTFDAATEAKRPSVQVGDPFSEKLLIEVCMELVERGLLVGLQDLGGAGLSCATSETASRGNVGMDVRLDRVPLREAGMEPFEILTSESQERMLAIVRPADVEAILGICRHWGVPAVPLGAVVEGSNLVVHSNGEVVADVPARSLADEGPVYDRPHRRPGWLDEVRSKDPVTLAPPIDVGAALLQLLASPNICSKRWVWQQYDYLVQHNTVGGPGGDAAVIRLDGANRALAISTDGNGRYCFLDPRAGAGLAVAEAARNVACVGARPIAITNCLNFGSPENPEAMWQFVEAVAGLGDACRALGTPVTGGNVSFYNETDGRPIHPTPIVGMLGVLDDASKRAGIAWREGDDIVLLGETRAELGGSEWAWVAHGFVGGVPPTLDLRAERGLIDLLVELIASGLVRSAHDCSEGGLGVALAECAIAGDVGASISCEITLPPHVWLFSESSARAVVTCAPGDVQRVLDRTHEAGIPPTHLGVTGGRGISIEGLVSIGLDRFRDAYEDALPRLLS
jgi:phosphoribosylformylglycinamidine synthase subunit PurL